MKIEKAFKILCQEITKDITLAYPSDNLPFYLATDASDIVLGAWLGQKTESGHIQPIAFASRKLSRSEERTSCYRLGTSEISKQSYWP